MTTPLPTPRDLARRETLPALLEAYAAAYPDQEVVVADDHPPVTAWELAEHVRWFSSHLLSTGLGRGDVIGVLLPNGWRWLVAVLGAQHAGMIVVPLNTFYREAELSEAVQRTHVRLLISDRSFFGRDYAGLLGAAGLTEADPEGHFRGVVFWPRGAESPEGVPISSATATTTSPSTTEATDVAFYVFTSGSSAQPKIVVLDHGNLVRNCYEIGRRQQLVVGDRLWMASPLFFGYGCANAVIVVLSHGLTFCLQERFDPVDSARFMQEQRCTVYYGLGPMTVEIIRSRAHDTYDLSALRTGTTGFSPEEKRLALEVLGVSGVCSVYGLTEGNGHSTMTDAADHDVDAVLHTQGTVLPTQEIRTVDPTSGEVITPADDAPLGEIQLRGCVTSGYLEDPDVNARSFTSDGWFRTGDLGLIDAGGRLHFAGRLKEVVKVNGITVSPAEVEALVAQHPVVDQAWAFGWPLGEQGEERLACAVVLQATAATSEDVEAELRHWMRARISAYKVPDRFIVIAGDEVPKTSTGKVSKRLIGEQFLDPSTSGVRR